MRHTQDGKNVIGTRCEMKAEKKKTPRDELTHGNDHQCHGPLNGNASEHLSTNNLHDLREFLPIQLAALIHIHLVEYFLAIFSCGGTASSWASVSGELQMNHEKSGVQLLLVDLARPIGIDRFEGPVRELLEILGTCPHVARFRFLCVICVEEKGKY